MHEPPRLSTAPSLCYRHITKPLTVSALVFTAASAHASLINECRPTDTDFICRLRSVLTFLDVAAAILGTLLLLAILAAVRAYRRKPGKLTPKDITPDAK